MNRLHNENFAGLSMVSKTKYRYYEPVLIESIHDLEPSISESHTSFTRRELLFYKNTNLKRNKHSAFPFPCRLNPYA
jgi:hypothetical protein